MRRTVAAAAILVCALGLAACNSSTSSKGTDRGSSRQGSGTTSAEKDSGRTGTPLAGTDPCTLLKPADVPELTQDALFKPLTNGDTCSGYDFAVSIKEVGEDVYDMEFHGSTVKALPDIAGHKAAISETDVAKVKSCNVVLEVTSNQLVDVTVMHDEDPSKACSIAKKAAAVVAGRIPA